ncbi:pyridoxal-phosphate-dependent aminotransferase family protein [Natranaerobius trueperi]|uniref:Aminotransferase n=1 Tax=Natranaerobius trueperi TaxID=759412 RepID=A0A226C133_9FIRM|nr:alanine--glyoxylate aminotransferase family protein [Natranaerobius trueperi]OWZ84324.1 aminotransferase [Natranaerobius trueperi]
MNTNRELVMIPGPTPVTEPIRKQLGRETAAFKDPNFVEDFKEVISDLTKLWNSSEVFVVSGSGTLAMEMAIANTLKETDSVLVISHGFFGDRMVDLCKRKGLDVDVLSSKWGKAISVEEIKEKLAKKKYKAVAVTHVDTSTGVKASLDQLGEVLDKHPETLFIVDGVCSTAGEPEFMYEMGIDVLITASQKAFGVPPGLAMVWVSEKAMSRREEIGDICEYYLDFDRWLPVMKNPDKYFGTPPVNLIWALKEAVQIIKNEGLLERFKRHQIRGRAVQKALEGLGFEILAEENVRASTLSNPLYPEGIEDGEFRKVLKEEGVVVAGGLGPYAGKLFRLGHMGNIDTNELVTVISAIERTLFRLDYPVEFGKGINILLENIMKKEKN